RKKISTTFRNRYRIILRRDENLEEKLSVTLTPLNLVIILCVGLFIFGTVIYMLLAYTPLNRIFPTKSSKYSNLEQFEMIQKIDSLELNLSQLNLQSEILSKVLAGEDVDVNYDTAANNLIIDNNPILEVGAESSSTKPESEISLRSASGEKHMYNFMSPLKGVISDTFDVGKKHLAIDIVAEPKSTVKSVQKGTVIFSGWTAAGGHTAVIQHPNNFISVYKHNAIILKKEGTFVNFGDAIALVGNSGELTSGPHLHFELWKNGVAVNPLDFISF
ncbi:MAG: M23 family metallopeptidase, partial [Bacteroidetes bacterium]|nr:M23 family metallopeptidase [Bacteroidota bacterium]